MYDAELIIENQDKSVIRKSINLDIMSQLIINKCTLENLSINTDLITNIDMKIKCKDFYLVIIENNEIGIKHYGISSYTNFRSSIAVLKLYNINLIHINDLDIEHIETENASPLIVRCNINELYTGCEVHGYLTGNKENICLEEYKVDIRRDTEIKHFSGNGKYDLNIQESSIKEVSVLGLNHNGLSMTLINRLSIWNGSSVVNLKLSAPTKYLEVKNSTIEKLTVGKSHIKEIKLQNEIIGTCSIDNEGIDSDDVAKWQLMKKSAFRSGNRIHYLNASYMVNKKYSELEEIWFRRLLLKIFSVICGYGYKPLRTIAASISTIVLCGIIYWVIGFLLPDSFSIKTNVSSFIDCIYYSGITFTTTGFGDISPVNGFIRIFSIIEAIAGVSMLSLFIFSLTKSLTEHIQN